MKKIHIILILLIYSTTYSQNETIYLLNNNVKGIGYGFAVNSKDKRFLTDYYIFNFKKSKGFKKNSIKFEYYTLDELRKEVSLDTINYKTIKEFTKDKEFWEIHNELSLFKNIYFVEKRKVKTDKSHYEYKYFYIPARYEGTRKNIIPTDLSIHK